MAGLRVAIVHDRLTVFGGAEREVLALQRVWPESDLFVSVVDPQVAVRHGFRNVRTTYLGRLPMAARLGRASLPLHPHAFRRLDLRGYDVVISSSAFFARCLTVPAGTAHVAVCYSPARFLWDFRDTHLEARAGLVQRAFVKAISPWLRRQDRRGARTVDVFVAISTFIAEAIQRCYDRESVLVPPPVDVHAFEPAAAPGDYLITLTRLDPHKEVDRAIAACNELRIGLKVVGDGFDAPRLRRMAGPTVEFLGWVSEAEKTAVVQGARALLAPQIEDFGIAMVEALAAGVPVIAPAAGGALDIVENGRTGILYDPDDPRGLVEALKALDELALDPQHLHERALRFSEDAFARRMREVVGQAIHGGDQARASR